MKHKNDHDLLLKTWLFGNNLEIADTSLTAIQTPYMFMYLYRTQYYPYE